MMLFRFPVFHKILQYWNIHEFQVSLLKHPRVPQRQAEPSTQHPQVSPPD